MVGKTSQRTQSGVGPRRGAGLTDLPAPKRAVIPSGGSGVGEAELRSGQKERTERSSRPVSERPRAPGARSTATSSDGSTQSTAGSRGRWDLPVPLGPKPRARREVPAGALPVSTSGAHPKHPAVHPGPSLSAPIVVAGRAKAAVAPPPSDLPDLSALEETADMPQSLLDLELPTEALLPPGSPGMISSPPTSSGPAWAAVLPVEPLAPASPVITRPGPSASPIPRALRGGRTPQPSPVPAAVPAAVSAAVSVAVSGPVPRIASEPAALPPPPAVPPSAPALAPAFSQDEVSRKIAAEPAPPAALPPVEPVRPREEKVEAVAPPAEPAPPRPAPEAAAPASNPALPATAKPVSKPSLPPPPDSASAETIDEQGREAERNGQSLRDNALPLTAPPGDEPQRSETSVPSSDTAQQRAALASSVVRLRGIMIVLAILAALLLGLIARTAGMWPSAITR